MILGPVFNDSHFRNDGLTVLREMFKTGIIRLTYTAKSWAGSKQQLGSLELSEEGYDLLVVGILQVLNKDVITAKRMCTEVANEDIISASS